MPLNGCPYPCYLYRKFYVFTYLYIVWFFHLVLLRRKKEIELERLKNQIKSRKPKGRDLTGEKWLETLSEVVNKIPQNEDEAKSWQARLLRGNSYMPYPVDYETNTDLTWLTNDKGRIFVKFNGINKRMNEPLFEVYCDSRQLHYFQRFCQDWQIWHDDEKIYSWD
ncbi:MAG: type V CRISPR-associated protein Cas12k [Nostoc sp.]|uniref:type V CRISPR-associated protein Cas12k n=1 Tax=Nostoc sp. TaxID=1180 RepID=UPI002FFB5C89